MKKGLEARLVSRENKQFISLERENKRKTEPYQEYYKLDEEAYNGKEIIRNEFGRTVAVVSYHFNETSRPLEGMVF